MFGYVKPYKAELKVCQWEQYRATYCGLCHALKRKFGFLHRFALSYDITFLTLVLNSFEGKPCEYERKRCIASPVKKKCVLCNTRATEFTADASVILSYFNICDSISDNGFIKSVPYRAAKMFFTPAYKKAKKAMPHFDAVVSSCISELSEMEKKKLKSIDAPADTFARILASLSEYFDGNTARIVREILYHTGRTVYLIDALCDMEEDKRKGNYNPVLECNLSREEVVKTINCSLNSAISALNLSDADTSIILNILSLGIPSALDEKENTNE